jgi:hypothetical protein
MRQSLFTSKVSKVLLIAAAATLAFGRMHTLNAAVIQSANTAPAMDTVIAFDNACADDDLIEGDEVTVEGTDYALDEDADGLFITVEGETYSVVSFDSDCETVSFQQVDGVDTLVGTDVDEDEADETADMEDDMDEEADADMEDDMDEETADADMEDDMDEEADADMEDDMDEEADADMEDDMDEEADADMEDDMDEETADADVEEE